MSARPQLIRRHTLEFRVADAALRATVQRQVNDASAAMSRELGRVMEGIDRPGRNFRIGRLELDLGELRLEQIEHGLCEALPRLLGDALSQHITALETGSVSPTAALPPAVDGQHAGDAAVSDDQAAIDALLLYLRSGRRAWWVAGLPWRQVLADCAAQLGDSRQLIQLWQQLPVGSAAVLRRAVSPGAWAALRPAIAASLGAELLHRLQRSSQQLDHGPWSGRVLALYLAMSANTAASAADGGLLSLVVALIEPQRRRRWSSQLAQLAQLATSLPGGCRPQLPRLRQALLAAEAAAQQGGDANFATMATTQALPEDAPDGDADAAIATPSAGLVILQPFIEMLFRACGLTDERGCFMPAGQQRGVALLSFLAWGGQPPQEPDVALEKLLCGLSPTQPWWPLALADSDRREAGKLLEAVIRHWQALKATSPDGLRQGFLQRPGRLQAESSGYRLRVERAGQDVLLQQLPWSINLISLPWMPRPLMVEWP